MISSYLDHLPAAFRQTDFIGKFLLAFEAVFTGLPGTGVPGVVPPGLERTIESATDYLDPRTAPKEFLPWLAGWVALAVRADWDEETTRDFIRHAVPLYRLRGTAVGLQRLLQVYLRPLSPDQVLVLDDGDAPEHCFQVQLTLSDNDADRLRSVQETARAIIELEKPAHTIFALRVVVPTLRLPFVLDRKAVLGTAEFSPTSSAPPSGEEGVR